MKRPAGASARHSIRAVHRLTPGCPPRYPAGQVLNTPSLGG
ncbi:hypothetical protein CSC33_1169 [Pseudomonas aeruginosa]|nr:hypothetical protein CSC33_1169 [Pseudomonas aeruginosa]